MGVEVRALRRQDHRRAIQFAVTGMHLDWYLPQGPLLDLYGRYFWYMELNRATQALGAYADGEFVGVLLADMEGEEKAHRSLGKLLFVRVFDCLQNLVAGDGVGSYNKANRAMFAEYAAACRPDGEIVFLAADPEARVRGIGTALLAELERREAGREVYLYTDSACTYQFYEHRGFLRAAEREILLKLPDREIPLRCLLYSKRLPE